MRQNIDDIFDIILEEIRKGKTIEESLKLYPEFAEELEPLLQLATEIKNLPKPEPNLEKITAALGTVKEDILKLQSVEKRFSLWTIFSHPPVLARAAAIELLIILIGWSSLAISSRTVPGDLFYPVKIVKERVEYIFTLSEEGKAQRHLALSCQRTDELVSTFKRKKHINPRLIADMLHNVQTSLIHTDLEEIAEAEKFVRRIDENTQYQIAVLQELSQCGCQEMDTINQAIKACSALHKYIQNRLNRGK